MTVSTPSDGELPAPPSAVGAGKTQLCLMAAVADTGLTPFSELLKECV